MKRKIAIACILAFTLTGCGNLNLSMDADSTNTAIKEDTANTDDNKSSDNFSDEKEDKTVEEDNADEEDKTDEETDDEQVSQRYYSLNYNNTTLYVVNEDGELVSQYDLEELGKELSDQFPGCGLAADDYVLYEGGILYFKNNYYDSNNSSNSYSAIYALDPESGEAVEVCRREEETIWGLDVYKGKLFFKIMPSGSYYFEELCYEIKDGLNFEEADAGLDAYYKATEEGYSCSRTNLQIGDCALRKFDEVGFDLVRKEQTIYKADIDGNLTTVYEAEAGTNVEVEYFDSDMAVFKLLDEDNILIGYYKIDLETYKTTLITDEDLKFYAFDGNNCYYTEDEQECLDMYNRKLLAYDITDGSSKLILEESTVPGTNTTNILDYYISVYGSSIFVPLFEEDEYVWNIIDLDEADPSPRSLGFVADTFSVFDYGTVEYISSEYKCPDCDTTLNMFYGEKFVLDSEYSDYADEINQVISDYIDGSENASSNSLMFANTSCDEHQEYPEMNCETTDYQVTDVSVIEDRYLTVSYSSYYYSGGAHGEPMRWQFLFDLTTGERLRLTDFYEGTEDEFKELVATKIQEDYSTAEPSTYFAGSEDEAYEQAYESAQIDDRAVFTEDGIDYMFYPYDLGPFASGFITVHITYEELLGRSTLSE